MAAVVDAIPLSKDAHGVYRAGGMRVTLELLRGTLFFFWQRDRVRPTVKAHTSLQKYPWFCEGRARAIGGEAALCYCERKVATDLIEINADQPPPEAIERAAAAVRAGKVVAIPSDALYTLVADPFNLRAVSLVFKAKGREIHRSLPLLIGSMFMAEDLASELSNRFMILARRFWPGPLTIIVPAGGKVPLKVTGNTGRLALRRSRCKVANDLIEVLNQPLISTSANISGHPTCRSGIEVFGTMDGRVALVLDGGMCSGAGATTVDITEPYWKIIKEGAIGEKEIAEALRST